MADLSEYELQRLEHIKRNQEFLARLGLVPLIAAEPESTESDSKKEETKSPRRAKIREHLEPVRRSARVLNVKPDYTGETIDNFGELLDKYVQMFCPKIYHFSLLCARLALDQARDA